MQLTVAGHFLLIASCLIAFAAIFWPSVPNTHIRLATKNESTSCPLGFTATGGDKARWNAAIHPRRVVPVGAARLSISANSRSLDNRYHLFFNATIWTGVENQEPRQQFSSFADSMLVRKGGIVAVGSLSEVRHVMARELGPKPWNQLLEDALHDEVHNLNGDANITQGTSASWGLEEDVVEYDMGGRFVMPGFVDAHVHLIPAGLSLSRVDLRGAASRAAFAERVAQVAARLDPSEWLLGGLWNEGEWGGEMPTAMWLDEVCGDRPAFLTRHDLHMALANTAALQLAGIGPNTPDPEGGIIDRDGSTGLPTGLLRERAMSRVEAVLPDPSVEERRAALFAASRYALSRGVTSLVDMGRYLAGDESSPWLDLQEVYQPVADSGELPVRVLAMMPLRSWRRLSAWIAAHGRAHPSGRLFLGSLKEFADGSLGSRTALMWEPYSDAGGSGSGGGGCGSTVEEVATRGSGTCGQRGLGLRELRELTAAAVRAGLQVAVHAIGDRAVDDVAETYGKALLDVVQTEMEGEGGGGHPVSPVPGELSRVGTSEGGTEGLTSEAGVRGGVQQRVTQLGQALRLRIEHVQHLSDAVNTSTTIARNGLSPVPNPLHLLTDAAMLLPRLGSQRATRAFALASLRGAGLRPALASDWPVVDLQPLTGVYAAVHRHIPPPEVARSMRLKLPQSSRFKVVGEGHYERADFDATHPVLHKETLNVPNAAAAVEAAEGENCNCGGGRGGDQGNSGFGAVVQLCPQVVAPEERLSLEEALLGHTAWAAAAAGLEDYVGKLAPGFRADFIELSDSLAERVVGERWRGEGEEGLAASAGEKGRALQDVGLQLSEDLLRCCLPVVTRTWLDGELVYDRDDVDNDHLKGQ